MSKKPNVLYIMADQLRYQSCGYAGDELAHTPNIDRLATEGIDLSSAVSNMPVCAAYRASLFTGKYSTSTGMVINEIRLNPDHHPRPLARCLSGVGYRALYIGKWHLYANEMGNHTDPKNSFVPPGKHRLGFDGYFAHYGFHHEYYGEKAYYHLNGPEKIGYGDGVYEPDGQTDLAMERLTEVAGGSDPFALFLSFGTPHDPWESRNVPERYYDIFRDTDFPPPPNYSDEMDPYGDDWSNEEKSPELINRWKRVYYAMTANLDYNIGRLMARLDELEIADDTIVIFTSDHGEMFGAQGRMKKNTFYEEAARVPFLVRWPGGISAGSRSDVPFGTVDIMPTILGLTGVEVPSEVEGMDISAHLLGNDGPVPEFAFLQNTGACAVWEDGHEWRAVRDRRYTYARYHVDGRELLFDHRDDPYQLHDLSDDPAHADTLTRLRLAALKKMEELNDTFEPSSYYKEHWVNEERIILRTAR